MVCLLKMTKAEFLVAPVTQLARMTGLPKSTWSRWLNGDISPKLDKMEELAKKLDMDLLEFVEAFCERRDAIAKWQNESN